MHFSKYQVWYIDQISVILLQWIYIRHYLSAKSVQFTFIINNPVKQSLLFLARGCFPPSDPYWQRDPYLASRSLPILTGEIINELARRWSWSLIRLLTVVDSRRILTLQLDPELFWINMKICLNFVFRHWNDAGNWNAAWWERMTRLF